MNHQKLTTLLLTMSLSALSLAGCGTSAEQPSADPPSTAVSAEAAVTETTSEPAVPQTTPDTQEKSPAYPLPTAAEDAGIYVEPIPDISDDFIRGMDVSSVLAEEKSGVNTTVLTARSKMYLPPWLRQVSTMHASVSGMILMMKTATDTVVETMISPLRSRLENAPRITA